MINNNETEGKYFFDPEAQVRFDDVVGFGREIFKQSGLIDTHLEISVDDLNKIAQFHKSVSPVNPEHPWRPVKEERPIARDPSFFSNWEAPGGPLEHIELASEAARIITDNLQSHLKHDDQLNDPLLRGIAHDIRDISPLHAAAAASLHDEGREVTHLFYTNEQIGRTLLKRVGIRDDLLKVLPDEKVMLTPRDKDMSEVIHDLPPEAVIVRIADEFGKRFPGSNRLYQPDDYTAWDREKWAEGYISKPSANRPSDTFMRENMQLHVDNVPRYFEALDEWVRSISTLTLEDITRVLNTSLVPSLRPL